MHEEQDEPTVVIFRRSRDDRSDIYALLPEISADAQGFLCESYQHFGEHAAADYAHCIETSAPATPAEYRDLLDEMTKRGYAVLVRQRATQEMHQRRRDDAHQTFLSAPMIQGDEAKHRSEQDD